MLSHAVDPGWVPTRMGGAGAPDSLAEGHVTQDWLATADQDEIVPRTGGYWYHRADAQPAPAPGTRTFRATSSARSRQQRGSSSRTRSRQPGQRTSPRVDIANRCDIQQNVRRIPLPVIRLTSAAAVDSTASRTHRGVQRARTHRKERPDHRGPRHHRPGFGRPLCRRGRPRDRPRPARRGESAGDAGRCRRGRSLRRLRPQRPGRAREPGDHVGERSRRYRRAGQQCGARDLQAARGVHDRGVRGPGARELLGRLRALPRLLPRP